ncbi:MAG: hypothetical protein ACP5MK_00835 [Candidatus Micrarchaeia archaeon]
MPLLTIFIAFLAIIVPGFFLALALLRKTMLNLFEITVIGFIFGLIFPPVLTWFESYFINSIHAFSFSAGLYNVNVVILTIIGIALCIQQGAIKIPGITRKEEVKEVIAEEKDYRSRINDLRQRIKLLNTDLTLVNKHEEEENALKRRQEAELASLQGLSEEEKEKIKSMHEEEVKKLVEEHEKEEMLLIKSSKNEKTSIPSSATWLILLFLMLLTFSTRMLSIGIAPKFFEFDPYFDMISTEYILTYGYQLLYDHAAWPTVATGTSHRIQPIIPYLEAYWYDLANSLDFHYTTLNTTLLSDVSSFYPPIAAALLVFVIFLFLYHEYGSFTALVGASLATFMPTLITTFVAGEQLLEPWGIFAMFFFYATYFLAVKHSKERRFAVLAGIAFASTFLGAHYYTVNAGVMAIYILLQGVYLILKKRETRDFYITNAIVIITFSIFYLIYSPYNATLTERIPSFLGVPSIIGFPLAAFLIIMIYEYVPILLNKFKITNLKINRSLYVEWLVLLVIIALLLVAFTSVGKPIKSYLNLSYKFTHPSTPLFMTVQEFEPSGINFDFGSAGFGIIAVQFGGFSILLWAVIIAFTVIEILLLLYRNSMSSILLLAAVWPLIIAAMAEVKYIPHFGVAYILALSIIFGELLIYAEKNKLSSNNKINLKNVVYAIGLFVVFAEALVLVPILSAVSNPNCAVLSNPNNPNAIGYDLYCNVVPSYWLSATAWMKSHVGPYAARILSWWDYGDWINWFGNSNAVIRGDNAVPSLDEAVAAQYVLSPQDGFGPKTLANFMNKNQTEYVIFDNALQQKWGALDFLACVYANETSEQYAEQQASVLNVSQPYVLGQSTCEVNHAPVYALVPLNTSIMSNFCQSSNSSAVAIKTILLQGNHEPPLTVGTYCIPENGLNNPIVRLYNQTGKPTNMLIVQSSQFFYGYAKIPGMGIVADFMVLYTPNGPNYTITDAPSLFYNSTYYKAFFFGHLKGFTLVYPQNFTGMNYINSTAPVMIFKLDNYSGGAAPVTPKPPWIKNNYTMPG